MSHTSDFLVILVDCNATAWEGIDNPKGNFGDILQSVLLFSNSHKMLNRKNETVVIAMNPSDSWFLNAPASLGSSGQKKSSYVVDRLLDHYNASSLAETPVSPYCSLAKALSKAMCGE